MTTLTIERIDIYPTSSNPALIAAKMTTAHSFRIKPHLKQRNRHNHHTDNHNSQEEIAHRQGPIDNRK